MANLKWLYTLLSANTESEGASLNRLSPDEARSFEKNSQEFMFDSLMDVPRERVDGLRPRH